MSSNAFKELEEKYPEIVKKMPDEFNSHFFILALVQKYQRLYVQALNEYVKNDQPFQSVHTEIAKRLKKRKDLVKYLYTRSSKNIFGHESGAAVWKKI
jgi:hypothetical protein